MCSYIWHINNHARCHLDLIQHHYGPYNTNIDGALYAKEMIQVC